MSVRINQEPLLIGASPTGNVRLNQEFIMVLQGLSGFDPVTLYGGAFQDAEGNPVSYGRLRLQLTFDCRSGTGAGQIVAARPGSIRLDVNGNIAETVKVQPNDLMVPSGSQYLADLFAYDGKRVWASSHYWTIYSYQFVNVATLTPN